MADNKELPGASTGGSGWPEADRRGLHVITDATPSFGAYARAVIRARAAISAHLGDALFADPAFEILLFLFAEGEEGLATTTNACCAISRVPRTTALRWISQLVDRGLVLKRQDTSDLRVSILSLSERARLGIRAWLGEISATPIEG